MLQTAKPNPPRRSMGLKLLLVCAMALVMAIPALFVWAIIIDRSNHASQVVTEIGDLVGGPQRFTGPILAVPYVVPNKDGHTEGVYIVFPDTAAASGSAKTSVRQRGLYRAPVWTADLTFDAQFDLTKVGGQAPTGATLDWSRAEILVGASDARGAKAPIQLTLGGQTAPMQPALSLGTASLTGEVEGRGPFRGVQTPGSLHFFGAPAAGLAQPGAKFDAHAVLKFTGAQRLALLAYGENTTFHLRGDWPNPSYDGAFSRLDSDRPAETKAGFAADWSVPYIDRGVTGEGTSDILESLGRTSVGVTFVEMANPYQAVSRSLKYAPIFLGLVFFAYFVFETIQKKRVHPAQYVLVGLAQLIFYLLLLSIAERIGFDLGFLLAAVPTVALISAYAGWAFDSRRQGLGALAAFSALYGLIYVLMRLEDWALLVGAVTSFAAIAAVMYFTRKIDWYGETPPEETAK